MVWNFQNGGRILDEGDTFNMQDGAKDDWWHGVDGYDLILGGKVLSDVAQWSGGIFGYLATQGSADEDYERLRAWDRMGGIMKIEPIKKKQKYLRTEVAYIAQKLPYPQVQRVPISGVKITPHQISFDFFDTTEGKIGVSNATEKHMVLECDVLVSELLYFMWNHAGSENEGLIGGWDGSGGMGSYTGMRFFNERDKNTTEMIKALRDGECYKGEYNKNGEGWWNFMWSQLNLPWKGYNRTVEDFQQTQAFIDFRNTLFQQFNGWVCQFTSEVFGVFNGVITEITYEIEDGSMDAKWHLKIEEAIFTDDYSEEGKKPQAEGSTDGSG